MKELPNQNDNSLEELRSQLEGTLTAEIVPFDWSEEEVEKVEGILKKTSVIKAQTASIPMICRGSKCPSAHVCPLYKEDVHVLNEPCPIESKIVYQLMIELADELEIDHNSRIEMGMVRDLVDQEIQQIRKQTMLANEDVIQENVIGISPEGEPVVKKELHLGIIWGEKIHKTKSSTLKQLLATRESRFKAGAQVASDAVTMSKVLAEYQRQDKMANSELLKKLEMGEEVKDEYIEAQIVAGSDEEEEKERDDE